MGGNEAGPNTIDKPLEDRLRISTVARRLLTDLRLDLPDYQFIQVTRKDNGCLGETGLVEHQRRLNRQVGQVARVEPDANRLVTLRP